MIVDTSAVLAIVNQEPGYERLLAALNTKKSLSMSAATFVELFIVVDARLAAEGRRSVERLLEDWAVTVVDVDENQARVARQAYADFGKGTGHKAQLNFGDTFSYALAHTRREPLLCVGHDFIHTDCETVQLS